MTAALLEQTKGSREEVKVTSQDAIIQVESGYVKIIVVDPEIPQLIGQGLNGKGKQEWPKGVPLLNANFRSKLVLSKEEPGWLSVAPLRPTGQLREVRSDLC